MSSVPPPLPPRQPSFLTDPDADAIERGMSEEQLRELYDSEEIDRFLSLFSAVEICRGFPVISRPPSPSSLPGNRSLCEEIALRYLLPIIPPSSPPVPLFTLGRLRLTTQRLYLAIQPVYGPFFASLIKLATWKERRTSSFYCAEIDRAAEFGQELSTRFSASSVFGVKEVWRIFKVFNKPKKAKVKKLARDKTRARPSQDPASDDQVSEQEISTVLDSEEPAEKSQENDVKRAVLQALAEIADLHERVKNIFIWRRPASSRIYGLVFIFLFFLTLFVPAQYLAKITCFIGGFFFWHVTPIIAALPSGVRLPPAFADVPTDAEHAMELISQRVAAGLPIRPVRPSRTRAGIYDKKRDGEKENDAAQSQAPKDKDVNWKKWGERAAVGMSWAEEGKRIFTAGQRPQNTNTAASESHESVETHTFPAQHTSAPGLITLTKATLYFTPLMASTAKLEIPLANLRGVKKKSGLFTALTITWVDDQGGGKEEKFRWVGGLDELFARLVATRKRGRG
ncbi:hypothetical protein B0H14DRAFT_2673254 [Mycena olivaceomarginata]|nr:hypothetical protein B0H14DRAFT_2673254 [Mycena olivaceomarginata]